MCNLSCSGGDRLSVAFPSAFQSPSFNRGGGWLVSKFVRGRSLQLGTRPVLLCGSWPYGPLGCGTWGGSTPRALPSDEERDGSICHVLYLKATPDVSLSGCDRIPVAFCLRVAMVWFGWFLLACLGVRPSDAERHRSIRRVQIRSRHPGRRNLVATCWSSPSCSEGDATVVAFRLLGFCSTWWCSGFSGHAMCVGVGRRPFWGFPEGVPCVLVPAELVLVTSQQCCFYGGCHASSLSPGAKLLPLPGTLIPARLCQRVLLRAAGVLEFRTQSGGENGGDNGFCRLESSLSWLVVALIRCGPASPSHSLALRWFQSHVGRSGVGPQLGRDAVVCGCVLGCGSLASLYRGGRSRWLATWRSGMCVLLLAAYGGGLCALVLGVSRGDTWLFLPDLVEVRDVGACVVRLWSHVVAPVFRKLLCLSGCVPRMYELKKGSATLGS
ncbi:hypothetical protein Taro_053560 [Colocasia esculenta]|uniref:Uncharacterized protein n=1 Tax=Colocasia esculenta TaxID=4460 RepID=A0A843XLC8_COLES|nr:hypothetical protein [Colocasia esculenta]